MSADPEDLARRITALEERLDAVLVSIAELAQRSPSVRLDENRTMLLEIRELLRTQATVLAEHGAALVAIAEILHRLPGTDEES